jgi:hypothetical protein
MLEEINETDGVPRHARPNVFTSMYDPATPTRGVDRPREGEKNKGNHINH